MQGGPEFMMGKTIQHLVQAGGFKLAIAGLQQPGRQ